MSIQALGIDLETMKSTNAKFLQHIMLYGSSVTLVGMVVVFLALVLTSLIISQLVHLNRGKKQARTISLSSDGKVKSVPKDLSRNVIVAAITALHMHERDVERRRKMVLTFRRTPINQWRASAILSMPNCEMKPLRRK
jgi:Na+-transporting methylmalonyl-CoA/oxaloacetate decarboxylase gamma subunit